MNISYENPVNSRETAKEFKKAVKGAKLLYDSVEVYKSRQKYQCALLRNGTEEKPEGYTLLYTSEIDKKVHLREVKYPHIEFIDEFHGFRPAVLRITNGKDGSEYGEGIMLHNGLVIVEPECLYINKLSNNFMAAYRIADGEKMSLTTDIVGYDGRVHLQIDGDPTINKNIWHIDRRRYIWVALIEQKLEPKRMGIYMILGDKIISTITYNWNECFALYEDDIVILRQHKWKHPIPAKKEIPFSELIKLGTEVEPGKEPKFTRVTM